MWKKILFILFVIIASNSLLAQSFDFTGNSPLLKIPLKITSNSSTSSQALEFGIDKRATAGIDNSLGESDLPPLGPGGVFDARFLIGSSESSYKDFRTGNETLKTGTNYVEHKIQFRPGVFVDNTTNIIIEYNIPENISVELNYILYNKTLTGSGTLTLTDGELMFSGYPLDLSTTITFNWRVTYNLPDLAVSKIGLSVPNFNPVVGTLQTVTAQLQDQYDRPFATAGTAVNWTTTGAGAALSASSTNTDANGKAVVDLTVATTAGVTHTIKAASGAINKTSDNIVVKAGAATKFSVTNATNSPAAGANLRVTGQLQDLYSNNVAEADRSVTWTATNGATLVLPSSGSADGASIKTDANGKSAVDFKVSQTAGTKHVFTAEVPTTAITGSSPEVTVVPGQIAKLNVVSNLAIAKAGSNVTITAQLRDAFDNDVASSGKVITWSKTGGIAGDVGGKFASATSTTNASGIATVVFTVAQASGIVHTVTGTDNSTPANTGTTGNIDVTPNDANKYMVTSSDANPTVNTNVTIDAQLTDIYGNIIATPTAKTVTWSYTGGTKGTFSSPTSTTDANGKATVTFTVDEKSGITQNVKATDVALLTGTSPNIITKAGAAVGYNVTASRYGPEKGDTTKITAQAVDIFNNAVSLNGKVITWSSTNEGSFLTPTSITDAFGKATIQFTTKNIPNTEHIITATDNSTPALTGVSPIIKTVSGPPAKYIVTLNQNNPIAGTQLTVSAQLVDADNNAHSTAGKEVTWSSTGGGTFAQAKTITDANGKAEVVFTAGTIAGNKHKLTATDNTIPVALKGDSEEITIKAAAASKFAFTFDKTNPIADTKIAVTAQLIDQYNNNAPESNMEVVFTSTNGGIFDPPAPGSPKLTPPRYLTDATGKVTTNFQVVKVAGTKHTITATVPSTTPLITGTSQELTVIADAPILYVVTVSDTLPKAGKPITVNAQLKDQYNNNAPIQGKKVTWSKTGGTGATGGSFASATSNTDANGNASVQFTAAQLSGTLHEIIATDNTTPTALTGQRRNIVVVPDDASKYIVTTSDTLPTVNTVVTIKAQLTDKFNNFIETPTPKTVTWSYIGGTKGAFSSPMSNTDTTGQATIDFTVDQKANVIQNVKATDNSSLLGSSPNMTTKAGAAATYIVTSSKYDPVKGDSVKIIAQAVDEFMNPVTLAGKTITWSSTNEGSFASSTSLTDAEGKASVMFTTKNIINTEHIVTATDNSTPPLKGDSPVITTVSGEPAKYIVTVNSYNPSAGSQIFVTAQIADEGDNPLTVAGKIVTWASSGGGTFVQEKTTTDSLGRAIVLFTVGKQVGSIHKISVTDNSIPNSLRGESREIKVAATNAYKLVITVDNNIAMANSKVLVTAQLKDVYDNNVLNAGKEIEFKSDNGGLFEVISQNPDETKFITDANGRVSANFIVSKVAGNKHTINANVTPDLTIISNTIELTVKANLPVKYIVAVNDTLPKAGKTINVKAQLKDDYDNNVLIADKQVSWSKTGGIDGDIGGKFDSAVTSTNTEGLAEVVFTVSQKSSIIHEIVATDNTLPTAITGQKGNIKVEPDDASKYILTADNINPVAGDSISLSAQLSDKYDNPVKIADKELLWNISFELPKTQNNISSIVSTSETKSKTNADGIAIAKLLTNTKSLVKHIVSVKDNSSPVLNGESSEIITKGGPPAKYIVESENYFVIKGGTTKITGQLADKNNNAIYKEGEIISFLVNNDGTMNPVIDTTDVNGKVTSTLKVASVGNVKHVVEIKGESLSGVSEELTVVDIVPSVLISPKNNSIDLPIKNQFVWSKSENATSYDMQISTDSTFTNVEISKTNLKDTTATIENLVNDMKYLWRVRANVGDASSQWSKSWRFSIIIAAPGIPELLSPANNATNIDLALTLNWNKAEGASSYILEFADNNSFEPVIKKETNITKEFFEITGLENGKTYYWRVQAVNKGGESLNSQIFSFETIRIVAQPQGFFANTISPNEVVVGWQASSSTPTSYVLERRTNTAGSNFVIIANPSGTSTRYTDVGLSENTEYQYRIKAIDNEIISEYSTTVTVLTPTRKINPPTVIVIVPAPSGGLSLNWQDNSDNELGFIIYRLIFGLPASGSIKSRSVNSEIFGEYIPIDTVESNVTQYLDNNTIEGAKYAYKVSAFAEEGISVSVVVETPIEVVVAPSEFTSEVDVNNKIILTWKDNSNIESGYIIQRKTESSANFVTIDSVEASVTTYTDEKTDEITSYTYLIYAYNANGNSSFTAYSEVKTGLISPTELTATESAYKVTLTWKDNSKKELKYKIEKKSLADPTYKELTKVEKDIVTYIDNVPNSNETYTYRISAIAGDVVSKFSNEFEIKIIMTDVEELEIIPTEYVIEQNYPNPFNPSTSIRFGLPFESEVHIGIYNLIGEKIAELEDGTLPAGTHLVRWDASNLPSGIYLYSINAKSIIDGKSFNSVKKMMLMK